MGCFNVTCSISNISIGHGDPVAFIPLVPIQHGETHSIRSEHMTLDQYFYPLCPPIIGEYNDYGSIENVKESAVTDGLQKFYNTDLAGVINILTETRGNDPYDTMGAVWETYAINKIDDSKELDDEWFKSLGMKQNLITIETEVRNEDDELTRI